MVTKTQWRIAAVVHSLVLVTLVLMDMYTPDTYYAERPHKLCNAELLMAASTLIFLALLANLHMQPERWPTFTDNLKFYIAIYFSTSLCYVYFLHTKRGVVECPVPDEYFAFDYKLGVLVYFVMERVVYALYTAALYTRKPPTPIPEEPLKSQPEV